MGCLGCFDGLEIALFGEIGGCPVSRQVGGAPTPKRPRAPYIGSFPQP